jgi:ribosomal protein S4E
MVQHISDEPGFMMKTPSRTSKPVVKKPSSKLKDGASCKVTGGVHSGKSGTVRDINTSKTGHVTITVVQCNGERFKTLAKNVEVVG